MAQATAGRSGDDESCCNSAAACGASPAPLAGYSAPFRLYSASIPPHSVHSPLTGGRVIAGALQTWYTVRCAGGHCLSARLYCAIDQKGGYRWSSTSRVCRAPGGTWRYNAGQDLPSANFSSSPSRHRPAVQPYLLTVYLGLVLVLRSSGRHAWPPFCKALRRNMNSCSRGTGCRCQRARVEAKMHPHTHLCLPAALMSV